MESILTSIKKLLGITEEYTHFDVDIIMHINSVFAVLRQLGVGPARGFRIIDETATWNDFLPDTIMAEAIKSYMYLKVSLLFDVNQPTVVIEARNRMIAELEWRINADAELGYFDYTEPVDSTVTAFLGSGALGSLKLGYEGE